MENTKNLNLPLLVSNQSHKELTHNEALIILDNLINNGVNDKDLTVPPENPIQNSLYIVANGASGLWEGRDGQLAYYDNGWKFSGASIGTMYWVIDEGCLYVFNGVKWVAYISSGGNNGSGATSLSELEDVILSSLTSGDVLKYNGTGFINSNELQSIAKLGVNAVADDDNKLSVKSDYVLFDKAINSSRVKVNKATSTDVASHLFQDGYSGRAEFGLIGDDNFTLKVSNDGESWNSAFVVDKSTGNIDFKGRVTNNGNIIGSSGGGGGDGCYSRLEDINISNNTEIIISGLDDGLMHIFEFEDINVNSDDVTLYCSVSNDGTNYIATGYFGIVTAYSIGGYYNTTVTNNHVYFNLISDSGGWKLSRCGSLNGQLRFKNTTTLTNFHSEFIYMAINDGFEKSSGDFKINNIAKSIKLFLSSGIFTNGKIKHYAIS